MKRLGLMICLMVAFGVGTILMAVQSPVAPPTERVLDCTSGDCHATELAFKQLHGPVAANACDMCHEYDNVKEHTFALKRQGARLCDFCHIGKTDQEGLIVHDPVKNGECIKCHNPHGSNTRLMLRADTPGEVCISCHESIVEGKTSVHSAVQDGDCLGCHQAHSSLHANLLIAEGRDLCMTCHADVVRAQTSHDKAHRTAVNDRATNATSTASVAHEASGYVLHEPVQDDCSSCHVPHASMDAPILKEPSEALCISCHEDIASRIADAKVPHTAVSIDRACLNCHAPHESEFVHLMKQDSVAVCMNCHEKDLKRGDGSVVAAVSSLSQEHASLHEPISKNGCADCHDVHGSDHRELLKSAYSTEFYQMPDIEAYKLCMTCHESNMLTEQRTTTATNFRNGDLNLHYEHVVAPGAKGRSCRVCHDTHASKSPRLLNEAVQFGEWHIPIKFEETETGGSCGAGCHRPRTYSRAVEQ